MSNVKLGKNPKTFKAFTVKFPMHDGEEGNILATFQYRTLTQFGQLLNQMYDDAGQTPKADEKPDFQAIYSANKDKNADHLGLALVAWDLDVPLNRENLQALADEYPAAAIALMAAYNKAVTEQRLGN